MNLEEKIKKSDMDVAKAKQRLEKVQKENQHLKELKAKKDKEEKDKRQKALGEMIESSWGMVDVNDPKFLEILECMKADFMKNVSSETVDTERPDIEKEALEEPYVEMEGYKSEETEAAF